MTHEPLPTSKLIELLGIVDPFLMIDTVLLSDDGITAVGVKVVSENDWFYQCHFVDEPIMPGVLQTETMLQTLTSAICTKFKTKAKDCLINKSSVNFLKKISGNGTLTTSGEISEEYHGIITGKAVLNFNGQKTCTGTFRFFLPSKLNMK